MTLFQNPDVQIDGATWPRPTAPLTDEEILARYSGLLWEGMSAFASDPIYAAEMVEAAALCDYRLRTWAVRSRLKSEGVTGQALTDAVFAEVGPFPFGRGRGK